MGNLNKFWCEMKIYEKISFCVGAICSVSAIILACLQLTGIWEKAINVFEPLLGVLMVTQAVLQWKKNKVIAVISMGAAIFIFVVSFIIIFIR